MSCNYGCGTIHRYTAYMYIYVCIYIYIYIYTEKATASAADLWDPRNGCLDACMLVCVLAWWQIWQGFGLLFGGLWPPVVSLGMVLASLLGHLDSTGSAIWPSCGGGSTDLGRFARFRGQKVSSLWQPVVDLGQKVGSLW